MSVPSDNPQVHEIRARAVRFGELDPAFARWAAGYGAIFHTPETQVRVFDLAERLVTERRVAERAQVFDMLHAADLITNAGMWLVAHMSYAKRVYLDGRDLESDDFKEHPEGHTGGALNMVPAYVGYFVANALSGTTRSWLMGQGHCVAAIDALNVLMDNMYERHAARYALTEEGLSNLVRDFYSYEITASGRPRSPLGSHVGPDTAGGLMEGGYLGFAELYYVHMPLPGEELVTFLSDGAFEEQRGSDWVPRWWRASDCGIPIPIMIANGRRIDQRTTMSQEGGVEWFRKHLNLNGFTPVNLDGRDPASFAWHIIQVSNAMSGCVRAAKRGEVRYPVRIPYGIAETEKGYGFPGAGTNQAHNLPLEGTPAQNSAARIAFNQGARRLWVPFVELEAAVRKLNNHQDTKRPKERDHPLASRRRVVVDAPAPGWRAPGERLAPVAGIDDYFCTVVRANPGLRPRVGNPDELRSNRLGDTLDLLKHRVTAPEAGVAEDLHGAVITALNEEAVIAAALANKGGLNLVASYEAFAVKMLGAIRQEIIFSRRQRELGMKPSWVSVAVVLTSHTWENGKNEQSHQDPTLCEALMGEMSDVSRVVFPVDWNTSAAGLREAYGEYGTIWTFVV
ncbi:MAG: xylulose 5-phosphate 3-epimerase, partial [Bdellovibrionales bacterium]|nr:xylulose 5-phosphate 3-epimerase [Bdellovibrionales bacterium]